MVAFQSLLQFVNVWNGVQLLLTDSELLSKKNTLIRGHKVISFL
jgi:hypothetical protein